MFGEKKRVDALPKPATSVEGLVGPRMSVTGDIAFAGALHVDGTIKGAVVGEGADALLVVTERGLIEGSIRAPHVEISGTLQGDVHSSERLKLGASARVVGNVHYRLLEMDAGAQVNGQMLCGEMAPKAVPRLTADEENGT